MPDKPMRPCNHPGCPALTNAGPRCPEHTVTYARQQDKRRSTSMARGYDAAWRRVRALALLRDLYLCQHCLRDERPVSATEVDHIVPLARGGARLDLANLQSLCHPCHSRKTVTEDGGLGNITSR